MGRGDVEVGFLRNRALVALLDPDSQGFTKKLLLSLRMSRASEGISKKASGPI
jgi:hypothetical protein